MARKIWLANDQDRFASCWDASHIEDHELIMHSGMHRSGSDYDPRDRKPRQHSTHLDAPACNTVKIGVVNYLNSKPLLEGLEKLLSTALVKLDYPSRLADALAVGDLDVALIPSVEYLRHADYRLVTDACVAARGPVLSVKLYSRVPPGEIQTLALDEGSRTSAALTRILLAERYGVIPRLEPLPLTATADQVQTDAFLLIGDRAMFPLQSSFQTVWDLGEEWYAWTGLPFVFAVWTARSGWDDPAVIEALRQARDLGEQRLEQIAEREAPRLGISVTLARHYLSRNLYFHLGSAERNGLRLFRELALRNGLLSSSDSPSLCRPYAEVPPILRRDSHEPLTASACPR
ncbi:MAG: chorismate dehydratase [Planctomycetaceae bacterium]|nr:MAG: chorismate dehydratase [Planctomycetaceae bacterium]